MNIAIIGCGYVAASYAEALPHHPLLTLAGAWDRKADNLRRFTRQWPCRIYGSEAELLADSSVAIVLNLTNPRNHAAVTRSALEAGKHVYSEKPLGMTGAEAEELVALARARGLMLASAPCSVLSETAETMWQALRSNLIGKVRLVYANFDDGMIAPHLAPWAWQNGVGVAWPAKDEFEVGCTYEHAGYLLSWLAAFFGPARSVTAFASCQITDKGHPVDSMAPDFAVGCLSYDHGVVARVTCSLVAPEDKSLTIIGEEGVLSVKNVRNENAPIRYRTYVQGRLAAAIEQRVNRARFRLGMGAAKPGWTGWKSLPYVAQPPRWIKGRKPVDFLRGPSEMVAALSESRPCRLPPELGWHIAEIIDAIQHPVGGGERRALRSTFPALTPHYGAARAHLPDNVIAPSVHESSHESGAAV